jgi:hypothetical protein
MRLLPQQKKNYSVSSFTRLFGNKNTNNKPWGTIEENGVGKFNDFTDKALDEIKAWALLIFGIQGSHIMHWWEL